MPGFSGAPSRRRLMPFSDTESESESDSSRGHGQAEIREVAQMQAEIMMNDLGSHSRHLITSVGNGQGNQNNDAPVSTLRRDCNQRGSEAARRAAQNKTQLSAWDNYFSTDDAKAAGGEILEDLNGGNTHRQKVRDELRQAGITTIQDTYVDRRHHRGQLPYRPGRGAPVSSFNARDHAGHGRGGGSAGRGGGSAGRGGGSAGRSGGSAGRGGGSAGRGGGSTGRGGGSTGRDGNRADAEAEGQVSTTRLISRPLDPAAVAPSRESASENSKPSRKTPQVSMDQGKVTLGPSKKAGQYTTPRLIRGPLPPHVNQLADSDTFEKSMLELFKTQAAAGAYAVVPKVVNTQVTQLSARSEPALPPSISKPQDSRDMYHIRRSELAISANSPDAFTDGHATTSNLSSINPSPASQAKPFTTTTSPIGLGLEGVALQYEHKAKEANPKDLMDIDIPTANKARLSPALKASPRDESFKPSEYQEYQLLKRFIASASKGQDFAKWQSEQKSKESADPLSVQEAKESTPATVDISAGYTVGAKALEGLIGDRKNLAARPKSTQTTPSLAQSKWASSKVTTRLSSKETPARNVWGKASVDKPNSGGEVDVKPLETISEVPTITGSRRLTKAPIQADNGNTFHLEGAPAFENNAPKLEYETAKIKPRNPFAPRESVDDVRTRSIVDQLAVKPRNTFASTEERLAPSTDPARDYDGKGSAPWDLHMPGIDSVKQRPQEVSKPVQPLAKKKGLANSKWSTRAGIDFAVLERSSATDKPSVAKPGPILGDSMNVQPPGKVIAAGPAKISRETSIRTDPGPTGSPAAENLSPNPMPKSLARALCFQDGSGQVRIGASGASLAAPYKPVANIFGDSMNVRKATSPRTSGAASQAAAGIERKLTGIKRSNAGPSYERAIHQSKAAKAYEYSEDEDIDLDQLDDLVRDAVNNK